MAAERLRYNIDTDICAGHGRCFVLAPDEFTSDDIGYGQVVDQSYPLEHRQQMENMVISCPEGAISIREVQE